MQYNELASKDSIEKTISSLAKRGILAELVDSKEIALEKIKQLIPQGSSVMNGSSETLKEIGFVDYLKNGKHDWKNLHEEIILETDPEKQSMLRRQSVLSDFYLGSAHAIAETGEIIIASNSGSQLPHLAYTSQNIILVVGTQKITSDLPSAIKRLEEYVYPLEDQRMKKEGIAAGSFISKMLLLNREPKFSQRKFYVIFVNAKLGF